MKRIVLSFLVVVGILKHQTAVADPPTCQPGNALGQTVPQILIESVVLEVELPRTKSAAVRHPRGQSQTASECFLGSSIRWFTNLVHPAISNSACDQPEGLSYVAGFGDGFDSMIAALANERRVEVIQKPRIQTPSGVPARLFIGRTVPCVGPSCYGPHAGGPHCSPPLEVGLELETIPVLEPDGAITMDIRTSLYRIVGATRIAGVGDVPNTVTTQSAVSVRARNGEVLSIGGAIRARKEPVPPVAVRGALFHLSNGPRFTELVIMLRPTVLPAVSVGDGPK